MFITGVNVTGDKLFTGVNATPPINPCHGFSVIASVVDAGDFSLVNSYRR
jgi:hypothetical protein